MKKSSSLIYFLGSVGLIIVAIVFTAFIERSQASELGAADPRVRAENKGTLQMIGQIASIDTSTNSIVVDNLTFNDQSKQDMGTWVVTPGQNVNISSLRSGANVRLSVEAKTFSIENHTLTARDIKITR